MGLRLLVRTVPGPALATAALLFVAAAAALPSLLITQAQSGKTFRLARGAEATLQLSERWNWTEPRVSSAAVTLTQVDFYVDPGYRVWIIRTPARGTATIRSTGKPACKGCGLTARSFSVTIVVR